MVGLPTGIGGIVQLRAHTEALRKRVERIRVGFSRDTLHCRPPEYMPFLKKFARLVYGEIPYEFDEELSPPLSSPADMISEHGVEPCRPRLAVDRPWRRRS